MLPCSDCRTETECKRYFNDILDFLDLDETKKAVGVACTKAVRQLARNLYDNQVKISGYRRMFLKDVVSAMTTSPVEGQIGETRKVGVNACVQMPDAINKMVRRVDVTLDERNKNAHRELYTNNLNSRSPTSPYLIQRGEGLVCRSYELRLPLKSAQVEQQKWITWNNAAVGRKDPRGKVYSHITKMMRVSQLRLHKDEHGSWFVQCDCGGKENLGVPCQCFFRICENAGVPEKDIVHLCMISPKYLKWWQTHYGTDTSIGKLLYTAQKQAFADKKKGIRVTNELALVLLKDESMDTPLYPQFGPNTYPTDFSEAMFMMKQAACTKQDILNYRDAQKSKGQTATPTKKQRDMTCPILGKPISQLDLDTHGFLSEGAQSLHAQLQANELQSPLTRKFGSATTKQGQEMYSRFRHVFDETKNNFLQQLDQLGKHHQAQSKQMKQFERNCMAHVTALRNACDQEFQEMMSDTRSEAKKGQEDSDGGANEPTMKFSGVEDSYVSPRRHTRSRGAYG